MAEYTLSISSPPHRSKLVADILKELFEVQPIILGGSPTDPANKAILSREAHWLEFQRIVNGVNIHFLWNPTLECFDDFKFKLYHSNESNLPSKTRTQSFSGTSCFVSAASILSDNGREILHRLRNVHF